MEDLCSFAKRTFVFRSAETDSFVFRLHYKLTFAILLVLSIVVGWKHHFGTPIECTSKNFPVSFANDFCYVHSTYSIKESWNKTFGVEVPYPGVNKFGKTKVYHTYYQWVAMMLFIQAIFFLVPRFFWNHMESGRVHNIVKGMAKYDLDYENQRQQNIKHLTRRLRSELHKNRKYFLSYIMTGVLNLVNVIVQIHLMNYFLRGEFSSLGNHVVQSSGDWSWISNPDPGLKLFPRVAMCDVHVFGVSGDVQSHSSMCLLPVNALNEKIYIFLWFWFMLLIAVSCFPLVSLLVFCLSTRFRILFLMAGSRLVKVDDIKSIVRGCNGADCFLIRLVAQNLSSEIFKDVVENIIMENSKKMELEVTTM